MITDGRELYGKTLEQYAAWDKLKALGRKRGWMVPALSKVADVEPLPAWVQQGQLVVTCPECAGRPDEELAAVWRGGPHVMFCARCGNKAVGGMWRPVALPAEIGEIEALLDGRPVANRTWIVGESLDNLRAENEREGVS